MGFWDYLLRIGAFFIVPLWYSLFRGREALKEVIKSKKSLAELVALSLLSGEIVRVLLGIFEMVMHVPRY